MLADQLKQTTQEVHQQLENKMDMMSRLNTLESYKNLLVKFYQYYLPTEEKLVSFSPRLPVEGRLKLPLLRNDLNALGFSNEEIDSLPAAPTPSLESFSEAVGTLYVLEGSTIGGQVISKHLRNKLNITPENGGSFFWAYGPQTMPMWLSFKNFLNSEELTRSEDTSKILESAKTTFLSLEKWVC